MFVKPNYGQEKIKSPSRPKKHPFVFAIQKMKVETNQPKEIQILSWVRKLLFCPDLTFEKCFCGSYLYLINLLNIISPTAFNKLATTGSRQIQREKNFNEYKRALESCGFVSSNKLEILNLKEIREIKKNIDLRNTTKNFLLEENGNKDKNESELKEETGKQQEEKESIKENEKENENKNENENEKENENENEMTGYSNNELIEKFEFLIQSLIYLISRYEKKGIIQERSFQFRTFYLLENMIGENISSASDYESDLDDLFTEEQIGVYLNDSRINLNFVSSYDPNKGTFKNLYFNKPTKKKRTFSSSQLKFVSRKIKNDSYEEKHKAKDQSSSGGESRRKSRSRSKSRKRSKSKGKDKGRSKSKHKHKHKHKKTDQDQNQNKSGLQSVQPLNEGNSLFIQQSSQSTSVITIDESWEVTTERTEESLFGDFSGLSEDEENEFNFIEKSLKIKNIKKKKKHKNRTRKKKNKNKKESKIKKKEEEEEEKEKVEGGGRGTRKGKRKEKESRNNNYHNNENEDGFEMHLKKPNQLQTTNKKSNGKKMELKLQKGEFEFEVIDFRNPNSIYLLNNLRSILNKKNQPPETPYILENYFSLNALNNWQNNTKKSIKSKYEFINDANDLIANCHLISQNILKIGIARFQLEISLLDKQIAKKNNSKKRWYQSEMLLTKSSIIFSIPELEIKNKIKWTKYFLLYNHKGDPGVALIESLKSKIFYRLRFENKFLKWVTLLTIIQFSMNRSNKKLFAVNPACQNILFEELVSNYVPLPIMPNKKFLKNYSNISKRQINAIFHNGNEYGDDNDKKNQEDQENQIYQNYYDQGGVNFLISVVMNREYPIIPGHLKIRHNKLKIGVMLKTAFNISFEKNIRIFSHPISNKILRLSFDSMDLQNEGIVLIALTKFERALIFGALLFFIDKYSKNKKSVNK
ncbi:transcription elongation factor b polypeptide 3 [Anaeramoeba flamelloides]|uniref:Transcription elongation factor b polypeptide 3 n=1 Tax=Anaeramoeba flamelloides TaxID=1746091 RepID=A0ABQ8XF09_9EUKA|nr:transcription elongation factor b polypeptide 3 [Anaeramoeba flamelloides]